MFMRAIRFDEVREGDVVGEGSGGLHRVSDITTYQDEDPPVVVLHSRDSDSMVLHGEFDGFVGLAHRPRPERVTQEGRLWEVVAAAREVDAARGTPAKFRQCLEKLMEVGGVYLTELPFDENHDVPPAA